MKKILLTLSLFAVTAGVVSAQTALDAYQLGRGDLKGTARFMGMGGAFTALGGDASCLYQNPAGIGVYRYSELNATMDIDIQSVETTGLSTDQTKVTCPNVSYIGTMNLGSNSSMPFFNWGISYGRIQTFDRSYAGGINGINSSLSNYVAGYTADEGWTPSTLNGYGGADPYYDSRAPWMSILLFNAYAINPSSKDATDYVGLYNGTPGSATFDVVEKGYVDQYNINFGGNVMNTVYWGIGLGITDIEYRNTTYYTETFSNAMITNPEATGRTPGSGQYGIESWKRMSGSGINFSAGVILRPVPQFRLGISIKTPTYYKINYDAWTQTNYNYRWREGDRPLAGYYPNNNTAGADDYFSFKYQTPLELNIGVAGVLGQKGILSLDYEYRPYQNMNVKDDNGTEYSMIKGDIKSYYKAQNIIRLGAEYRLTPNWSIRAGYVYESSPVTAGFADGDLSVYTSGPDDTETQASFICDKSTQYITAGIGWHYQAFYFDAAYVHRYRQSDWYAFTNYDDGYAWVRAPHAVLTDHNNRIVLSLGFKF